MQKNWHNLQKSPTYRHLASLEPQKKTSQNVDIWAFSLSARSPKNKIEYVQNPMSKSKRSPRFRIHHLCMLYFNSCLFRSRKSKKKIGFALRKNLKLKISEFRPTRPHKKTTYRHQRHLHRYTCARSFVYHPLGVYAREAGACEGENLQENWF